MKTARIYAFGDSLTVGTYDSGGGWCDRLKRDLHRITAESTDGTKRQVYNLGIGGETSRGLNARIQNELGARHSPEWPAVILIATGKNDSRLLNGKPDVPLEEYDRNLRNLISLSRAATNKILLIGLGPCADEEIGFKSFVYSRDRLRQYDDAMTQAALDESIEKIQIFDQLVAAGPEVHYKDKLHLSDRGYELIYAAVKPHVMQLLEG